MRGSLLPGRSQLRLRRWPRLGNDAPSVAVLDFALKDGPCTELATHLMAQGVPVIVCSGWPRDSEERPELSKVTWLEKPFGRVEFLKTISALAPVLTPQLQTNL